MLRALTITTCSCAAIALPACGSSDPTYCKQREQLSTQIAQIRDTNVIAEGTQALRTRIEGALTQIQELSDGAKSDFPNETRDLKVTVDAVRTSLSALESPATRAGALANLPGQLWATADAAEQLQTAIEAKCS